MPGDIERPSGAVRLFGPLDLSRRVRGFTADVLPENKRMIKVFERSGSEVTFKLVDGSYEVLMIFPPAAG